MTHELRLLLAISRARNDGFLHLAASLVALYKLEIGRK